MNQTYYYYDYCSGATMKTHAVRCLTTYIHSPTKNRTFKNIIKSRSRQLCVSLNRGTKTTTTTTHTPDVDTFAQIKKQRKRRSKNILHGIWRDLYKHNLHERFPICVHCLHTFRMCRMNARRHFVCIYAVASYRLRGDQLREMLGTDASGGLCECS